MSYRALMAGAGLVLGGILGGSMAQGADVSGPLPAVSGVNGKVDLQGGAFSADGFNGGAEWSGGAVLSLPLEDRFGLQGDIAAANLVNGDTAYGGALHFFTRDPSSYLLGVTGGAFWTNSGDAQFVGPEFELYSGPLTLHATGGYMNTNFGGVNAGKFFGIADVSFYASENFALKLGAKDIADNKTGHAGFEWQFSDTMPVSFTLDGKIGDGNYRAVDAGLTLYFGAPQKSLQRRHREDDPTNEVFDIFTGAGNAFTPGSSPPNICVTDYGLTPDYHYYPGIGECLNFDPG